MNTLCEFGEPATVDMTYTKTLVVCRTLSLPSPFPLERVYKLILLNRIERSSSPSSSSSSSSKAEEKSEKVAITAKARESAVFGELSDPLPVPTRPKPEFFKPLRSLNKVFFLSFSF